MRRSVFVSVLIALAASFLPHAGWAHCEIPCGIYNDPARIMTLREDAVTIETSVNLILQLAGKADAQSANQMARWVMNKENHATHIMDSIAQYFLAQRVKPVAPGEDGYEGYLQKLSAHHRVMTAAMKTKQNADLKFVEDLKAAIEALAKYYE
jgi:nickel superoxide dismutase